MNYVINIINLGYYYILPKGEWFVALFTSDKNYVTRRL